MGCRLNTCHTGTYTLDILNSAITPYSTAAFYDEIGGE